MIGGQAVGAAVRHRGSSAARWPLAAAAVFSLLTLLVAARWPPMLSMDRGGVREINEFARGHTAFVQAMQFLSWLGSGSVEAPLLAMAAVAMLVLRRFRLAVLLTAVPLGGVAINNAVKALVERSRPVLDVPVGHAPGWSFPSGHAQAAMVTALVLLLALTPLVFGAWVRVLWGAAAVLVLGIGFSRIALGVHFVSDVVGGYLLGLVYVAVCLRLLGVRGPSWLGGLSAQRPHHVGPRPRSAR
jgi:membrane-associated phospholipid phosphatase